MSTTVIYGRRASDLLVTEGSVLVEGVAEEVPAGHLHFDVSEYRGGAYLSRVGVLELRDVIDRWLAAQQTEAKEDP